MPDKDPRAAVVAKSLKDPAFRAELLKSPAAAVEKALGVKLPAGVSIKIVEDTASVVHLVLPRVDAHKGKLSDDELSSISGGAAKMTIMDSGTASSPPKCFA